MAKVRSRCNKIHEKKAKKFLLGAINAKKQFCFGHRLNQFWVDQANLKPILSFLANRP